MRKNKVKVVIWGFGAMGSGMAKMILKKEGFEIVGVCDINPNYIGKSLFEILNITNANQDDVMIMPNIEDVVKEASCDICLLATDSFTANAFSKIKFLLEKKVNVISTAEEMSYPQANQVELAKIMNQIAKANGVSVLGTGVNPGMMMDLLVIFLTGVMSDIESIEVSRINSLSPYGKTVMNEQGVGLTINEFYNKMYNGELAGHVGFNESIMMIGDALGINIDKIKQHMTPIITSIDRKSEHGFAKKGDVAGVKMSAEGFIGEKEFIKMNHPQQIEPHLDGVSTGDYINIKGTPNINLSITPEVHGGIGTIAICVNMIPHVINAKPGLRTMIDLPVPRAIFGDVRKMIE